MEHSIASPRYKDRFFDFSMIEWSKSNFKKSKKNRFSESQFNRLSKNCLKIDITTFHRYSASIFAKYSLKCETPTIHFSYFVQSPCLRKNKQWNPFDISQESHPWCEMMQNARKNYAKCEKSAMKYPAIHFSFFAFREHFMLFCEKCISSLKKCVLEV